MNIRLLRIFKEVCDTGSVTKAAENLYMTQPAVSHAIKELEHDTGLTLFDRLGRKIYVSSSGALYLEKVQRILALCDELEHSAEEIEQQTVLKIGSCITIACGWLADLLKRYDSGAKRAVNVTITSAKQVMDMLERNEIEIGLYEGTKPGRPFMAVPFSSYQLIPVAAAEHPFAAQGKVPLSSFLQEKLLFREQGSAVRDVFDSYLRLQGIRIQPVVTSTNTQALIKLVSAGVGVSILPDITIEEEIKSGRIAAFEIEGVRLENKNWIVYHEDKQLDSAVQSFLNGITAIMENHEIVRH